MPRIQQLPPSVVTKIAAGEVIERPASVVKELLENALDAGSRRIDIEVAQGGLDLIRVVDDGCGISADDLPLAFASHATSKLADAEGLFRVGTFGFRGEALASIASVAQVVLQSRPQEEPYGAEITCRGGDLSPVRAWNGAPGTRIEVRHLFYNTPVRRKFLRGPGVEMGHVGEVFTRLALSPRAPHLSLRHNSKPVHELPLSADVLDRIALLFGPEVRAALYPVEATLGVARLEGYVADPSCERAGAGMQYWYVNGRWVRDRGLSQALQDAYRGLLMTGRHAVAFLFLELPPDAVDVNVHPTKAEIRFRDRDTVQELVRQAVRDRLRAADLTARLQPRSATASPKPSPPQAALIPELETAAPPPTPAAVPEPAATVLPAPGAERRTSPPPQPAPPPTAEKRPGRLKALQAHDLYLVAEVPEGILIIDQHALHERILFAQLKRRLQAGTLERQRLLLPESVTVTARQAALVLEHRQALAELGLEVEDFGGNTVLVTTYPALLGRKAAPATILRAVVDYLAERGQPPAREQFFNDLLALMACHAAVRAGDRLTADEIAALLAQRPLAEDAHHCPHGRPTSLLLSRRDLDREFRRK
jgi:DNA mismatch repair protein MutL